MKSFKNFLAEALDPANYEVAQKKKGSLFLGRMQPIHNGHDAIIKMLKFQPFVVVVKGAKSSQDTARNPFDFKYQQQLIKKLNPKVEVIQAPTGYIPDMINGFRKQGVEIVEVLAGNDRIGGYMKQVEGFNKQMPPEKQINIVYRETPRITSATTVRNAIRADDFETFKKNVPNKLWKEYDKMKKILGEEVELQEGVLADIWDAVKWLGRETVDMFKDIIQSYSAEYKFEKQEQENVKRVLELINGDPEFKKLVRNSFEIKWQNKSKTRTEYGVKKGQSLVIKQYMLDRLPDNEKFRVNAFYKIISAVERGAMKL